MSPTKSDKSGAVSVYKQPGLPTLTQQAEPRGDMPSFAIALGGGGARGLAHIPILEALDELGIRPRIIAGTSIGALMGAAYASGISGADMRSYCSELFSKRVAVIKRLFSRLNSEDDSFTGFLSKTMNATMPFFPGERVLEALLPPELPATFEGLKIPFLAVTTDFYMQTQYVISEGPLIPAIAASAALPGVLRPVELDGRVLVDGGFVNPLPFDVFKGEADVTAAIDVSPGPSRGKDGKKQFPSLMEAMVGSPQIALNTIIREKLKTNAPDILIRPHIGHFLVLDFFKFEEIFTASEAAKEEFKRACEKAITRHRKTLGRG
ncbi:MAG: patatin-like phospholipase family protein [Alphaproteobacteria bacterium]